MNDDDDDKGDVDSDGNQANSKSPYSHHLCSLMTKYTKTIKAIGKTLPQKKIGKLKESAVKSLSCAHKSNFRL